MTTFARCDRCGIEMVQPTVTLQINFRRERDTNTRLDLCGKCWWILDHYVIHLDQDDWGEDDEYRPPREEYA